MNPPPRQLSRHMSAILRHRAGELGLRMDAAGWGDMDELVAHLGVPLHLVEGMPVTQEALEASWTIFAGAESLWHGTRTDTIENIAREGILRGGRSHVHLAETRESQVGKRANVSVLLEVSPARLRAAG